MPHHLSLFKLPHFKSKVYGHHSFMELKFKSVVELSCVYLVKLKLHSVELPSFLVLLIVQFRSVQFSHSVVSDSLRSQGLLHARPSCPSPTPGSYSNSCPLSSDAIQPSHPLSSPSLPAFNLSQHPGLFK